MRLIDADKLIDRTKEFCGTFEFRWTTNKVLAWISDAETEEAACVTRCKDCKWWNKAGCAIREGKPTENDFCSFGEKREVE